MSHRSHTPSRRDQLHELETFLQFQTRWPQQIVDRDARADGDAVAHGALERRHGLQPKARAVLERAAPAVGALVVHRLEELGGKRGIRADHLDVVEACVLGAFGGVDIHLDEFADVVFVALMAIVLVSGLGGHLAGAARNREGFAHWRVTAPIPQLDTRQSAVAMHALRRVPQIDDVALVPQAYTRMRRVVGFRVDGAIFHAHDAPTALGLHGPKGGLGAWPVGARAVAVRDLKETIRSLFRADPNGLEQDVIRRVMCHRLVLTCIACVSRYPSMTRPASGCKMPAGRESAGVASTIQRLLTACACMTLARRPR